MKLPTNLNIWQSIVTLLGKNRTLLESKKLNKQELPLLTQKVNINFTLPKRLMIQNKIKQQDLYLSFSLL